MVPRVLLDEAKTYVLLVTAITSLLLSIVYVAGALAQATLPQTNELFVPAGGGQASTADYSVTRDPQQEFAPAGYELKQP